MAQATQLQREMLQHQTKAQSYLLAFGDLSTGVVTSRHRDEHGGELSNPDRSVKWPASGTNQSRMSCIPATVSNLRPAS